MSSERETLRLQDIVENADAIADYLRGFDFDRLAGDPMRIDAVERRLERIIEAAVKIGPERMGAIAPGLPMEKVRSLGNWLRHAYDLIDLRTIWVTATVQIPELRNACAAELEGLTG